MADALQLYLGGRLARERGVTFFGCGFCSDESPPRGRRFTGYRFQITWIYVPLIPRVEEWERPEYDERAPVRVEKFLLDVVHCPKKAGATVVCVVEKQLGRVGLTRFDTVSGTGDGGGENAGTTRFHSAWENSCRGTSVAAASGILLGAVPRLASPRWGTREPA